MHLGQWDKLATYNEQVNAEESDKPFWKAAVYISKGQLQKYKQGKAERDWMVQQQDYYKNHMIELKMEYQNQKAAQENVGEYSYIKLLDELEIRKKKLKDIWHDRLSGAPKDIDVWYRLLSTRQLYLPKVHDLTFGLNLLNYVQRDKKWFFANLLLKYQRNNFRIKVKLLYLQLFTFSICNLNMYMLNMKSKFQISSENISQIRNKSVQLILNQKQRLFLLYIQLNNLMYLYNIIQLMQRHGIIMVYVILKLLNNKKIDNL
ncbi:unnamed protein product [Paramecium sonneborni]|uniref:PIK-related kinase FAT domain-containing protein n=1 Tax=Paramecium sonneborni TaxID=65129 RepID=A0A8S1RTV3_9CILI|nr:unnamed protein product [Paramecium sonneborni]